MQDNLIAHVRKKADGSWDVPHWLDKHHAGTAEKAEAFAAKFGSGAWGKVLGLLHDAGKGRAEWQKYLQTKSGYGYDDEAHLEGKKGKILHAIYGASLAEKLYGKAMGRLLSYGIAGHHAGLPDWSSAEGAGSASMQVQQAQNKDLSQIPAFFRQDAQGEKFTNLPWNIKRDGLDFSLWVRMLFSALVDADYLDTEGYMDPEKAGDRGGYCTMKELLNRLHDYMMRLDSKAENTPVNVIRRDIRRKCVETAKERPGIFSLSVPTGGGKTLSSLAFALEHAVRHGLERVIYVIPYTSIIEQNADVFRSVLGDEQVVEHHSSLEEDDGTPKSRLAVENWDAPVIVTTTVQFFESLFAAKPGRCRKLHNIARSVVILDEAQLLPVEFLRPLLETMQLLADHYHVSFIISTATQPAFKERKEDSFRGLRDVREIIGDADEIEKLYRSLRRYRIVFPGNLQEVSGWEEIAAELKQYPQALCVVSDRKSCRELYSLMPKGTFHLSALMCGRHRSEVIQIIKQKLKNAEPVRVISTQLVEAGVDFDFPVVYRALAGLDSIAQAAGRCNREGKIRELGKVVVFNAPRQPKEGLLRKAADTTCSMAAVCDLDPMNYDQFALYFKELYRKANSLDVHDIMRLLIPDREVAMFFRTAANRFSLIDDGQQQTILVRYGEGERLIDLLKTDGPDRQLLRRLQRYTVNIYTYEFEQMRRRGALEQVQPGMFALASSVDYSEQTGLVTEEALFAPEEYMM